MRNTNLELSEKEKKVLNTLLTLDMDRVGMSQAEQKTIRKIYNRLNGIVEEPVTPAPPKPIMVKMTRGSDIFPKRD